MSKSLTVQTPKSLTFGPVAFEDHPGFEGTVARAVCGAGAGAMLAHLVSNAVSQAPPFTMVVTFLLAGALTAVGAKKRRLLGGGVGAVLGLLGGLLHGQYGTQWPLFAAMFVGALAAPILARGESNARMAATGLFSGLMTFAGLFVANVLYSKGIFAGWMAEPLGTALAGGSAGLFLGLGAAPRHLKRAADRVESAYAALVGRVEGELRELLEQTLSVYRAVCSDLSGPHQNSRRKELQSEVSTMALRILAICERCQEIESNVGKNPEEDFEARIAELEEKANAATDQTARDTLRRAIETFEDQRQAVMAIVQGRERVVAQLHANVALLQKIHLSLIHLQSSEADRAGAEMTPVQEGLDELSRHLEATAQAVGEVYAHPEALLDDPELAQIPGSAPSPED